MRLPLIIVLAVVPSALAAQSVAGGGERAAAERERTCETQLVERATIVGAGVPRAALDSAAAAVRYWLRAAPGPRGRAAELTVSVGADARVAIADGARPATDSAFAAAARRAVDGAVADGRFRSFAPPAGPSAAVYTVYVGRSPDGRLADPASRRVCFAVARPDNPKLSFPAELRPAIGEGQLMGSARVKTMTQGTVRARFRVDSARTVVPGSVTVVSASDEAFAREIQRGLPSLRFVPASIDGRPLAQVVEQDFEFSLNY